MTKIYVSETSTDSIQQIQTRTCEIILFERKDIEKSLSLTDKPGIYMLYNDEQIYVGQSTNQYGVSTRLKRHNVEKLWWNKCIVISPHQITTKTHLDYIERHLISTMKQYGNHLDNKNKGNISPIRQEEQAECELFLSEVLHLLSHTFNIELYRLATKTYVKHLEKTVQRLLDGTLEDYS